MAQIMMPRDFKEFLRLLNSNGVEYLLVGGYAVGLYGHVRATNDLDLWVRVSPSNALHIRQALQQFGFASPELADELFLAPDRIIRMGVPPMRIEILTSVSGVEFGECYAARESYDIDGIPVPLISLPDLRRNKAAAGRLKDLADLESLPG